MCQCLVLTETLVKLLELRATTKPTVYCDSASSPALQLHRLFMFHFNLFVPTGSSNHPDLCIAPALFITKWLPAQGRVGRPPRLLCLHHKFWTIKGHSASQIHKIPRLPEGPEFPNAGFISDIQSVHVCQCVWASVRDLSKRKQFYNCCCAYTCRNLRFRDLNKLDLTILFLILNVFNLFDIVCIFWTFCRI